MGARPQLRSCSRICLMSAPPSTSPTSICSASRAAVVRTSARTGLAIESTADAPTASASMADSSARTASSRLTARSASVAQRSLASFARRASPHGTPPWQALARPPASLAPHRLAVFAGGLRRRAGRRWRSAEPSVGQAMGQSTLRLDGGAWRCSWSQLWPMVTVGGLLGLTMRCVVGVPPRWTNSASRTALL